MDRSASQTEDSGSTFQIIKDVVYLYKQGDTNPYTAIDVVYTK